MAAWTDATRKRWALKQQRERRKLRELVHFLLVGRRCEFCGQPVSVTAERWTQYGDGIGPELTDALTLHHRDGNHANNAPDNVTVAHRTCHQAYHLRARQGR